MHTDSLPGPTRQLPICSLHNPPTILLRLPYFRFLNFNSCFVAVSTQLLILYFHPLYHYTWHWALASQLFSFLYSDFYLHCTRPAESINYAFSSPWYVCMCWRMHAAMSVCVWACVCIAAGRFPHVSWVLLIKISPVLISLRLKSHTSISGRRTRLTWVQLP